MKATRKIIIGIIIFCIFTLTIGFACQYICKDILSSNAKHINTKIDPNISKFRLDEIYKNWQKGNVSEIQKITDDFFDNYDLSKTEQNKVSLVFHIMTVENYSRLGYFDKALKIAETTLLPGIREEEKQDKIEHDFFINFFKIILYTKLGDYKKAEELFQYKDIKSDIDKKNIKWHYYMNKKDYQNAVKMYETKNIDNCSEIKKLTLAASYILNGEYQEANNVLLKTKQNDIIHSNNRNYLLAYFNQKLNRKETSASYYELVLKGLQNKNYADNSYFSICTKYNYGILENNQGMITEAEKLFASLNLTEESHFKNNINDFCEYNMFSITY